jgi:hypothetical protein
VNGRRTPHFRHCAKPCGKDHFVVFFQLVMTCEKAVDKLFNISLTKTAQDSPHSGKPTLQHGEKAHGNGQLFVD